jgi:hypothetical protein
VVTKVHEIVVLEGAVEREAAWQEEQNSKVAASLALATANNYDNNHNSNSNNGDGTLATTKASDGGDDSLVALWQQEHLLLRTATQPTRARPAKAARPPSRPSLPPAPAPAPTGGPFPIRKL